ncbi:MAG: sigma-54-dependent Fis family transcriptional regulator [Xanthomonadaceae bacterium]|nr:sigma-54-dependent Fis family transcriptional regulator [Xanthomonadaceae bacterium]
MRTKPSDPDATLSLPLDALAARVATMPGLTVLWHPRHQRIGEQAVVAFRDGAWELSRASPDFHRAGSDIGEALEHRGVSRKPLRFLRGKDDSIAIEFPDSRMHCEIDGEVVPELHRGTGCGIVLDAARIKRGVVLRLGSVLLCLGHVGLAPSIRGTDPLIGVGPSIARVRAAIAQVATTDMPVLVRGETGTGKELVAQAIHAASARSHRTLVSVNMATLGESLAAADLFGSMKGAYTGAQAAREGFFAEAEGGTLFLDEIGDTPIPVQPMLLRTLETGEYRPLGGTRTLRADVRLIAATDRDLSSREFNQPLLRRLEAFLIQVPPLRERREDIGVLIVHFLRRWHGDNNVMPDIPLSLVQSLCLSDWPGNVRQLGHAIRRCLLSASSGGDWAASDIADMLADSTAPGEEIPTHEATPPLPQRSGVKRYRPPSRIAEGEVMAALEANQWCVRKAAESLLVSRPSFYALLDAIPEIRRAEAIPVDEIEAVVRLAPDDPTLWAAVLRTPRESLRRRVRALGLLALP